MSEKKIASLPLGTLYAGRYELTQLLGRGGMAEVYRAHDTSLHIDVALKVLHESLAGDVEQRERFLTEARVTRKIQHPNVVRTYDVGEAQGRPFFAMELLEGETLKEILQRHGALPVQDAIVIAEKILSGMEAVHNAKILHRDIKPSNIVFTKPADNQLTSLRLTERKFGIIKITDFGVAAEYDESVEEGEEIAGSAPYMAPECWKKKRLSYATDLYAFGILFYEMLAGVPPFVGESSFELMAKHFEEPVPTVHSSQAALQPWVQGYIEKLLVKEPLLRFQHAGEALSVLFQATLAPEEVSITIDSRMTSKSYKRDEYVKDSSTPQVALKESFSVAIYMLKAVIVVCSLLGTYFFLWDGVGAVMMSARETTSVDWLPLAGGACFLAIILLPIMVFTLLFGGIFRALCGYVAACTYLGVLSLGYFYLNVATHDIPVTTAPQFFMTKPGRILFVESLLRVGEPALMLPPNSLGLLSERKQGEVVIRTKIFDIASFCLVFGGWIVSFGGILLCFWGRGSFVPFFIAATILSVTGFADSYIRSLGFSLLGMISVPLPLPLVVSVVALISCAFAVVLLGTYVTSRGRSDGGASL